MVESLVATIPDGGPDEVAMHGDRLGRYLLIKQLGAGAVGTVYAAYDPVLDRKVALKVLRPAIALTAQHRARLLREARAMARVASPNIVQVFDTGELDGFVYIAMELVQGGTLRTWLAERTRDWREIARVFEAAGRGLAAAHAAGLVHRDFKPDNVLLAGERACVGDFGLASAAARRERPSERELVALAQAEPTLTRTGAVMGTPAYMAPEQLDGEPADARSDQFSFCVALYEALYGTRPFPGGSIVELANEMRARPARAPWRPIPSWLRELVMRGLAIDPAARHPSMDAIVEVLRARGERRWARRALLAVALVGIAALVLGLAAAVRRSRELADARLVTNLIAQGKRELADGRAFPALAYFGEAMRHGADGAGLRQMIALADRGRGDELAVVRGKNLIAIAGSPNGWVAAADRAGVVHFWSDAGAPLGEVQLPTTIPQQLVRLADDSLLVGARDGVFALAPDHRIAWHVATPSFAIDVHPGPAADEVTVLLPQGVAIYGHDGRRRHSAPSGFELAEGALGDGFAVYLDRTTLFYVDVATLTARELARGVRVGPYVSDDRTRFAYVADDTLHVAGADGRELAAFELPEEAYRVVFAGDRIAALGYHQITIFDAAGKRLRSVPRYGAKLVALAGDELWTGDATGTLRRFRERALVASLPVDASELLFGARARHAFGALTIDGSLVIVRVAAEQLVVDPAPCRTARAVTGEAIGSGYVYVCDDALRVFAGRHWIGDYPPSNELAEIAFDAASGRGAASGEHGTLVFDAHGRRIAASEREGVLAFADADHVFVVAESNTLWRWTLSTDRWERLATLRPTRALAIAGDDVLTGGEPGVLWERTAHGERVLPLGHAIDFITVSADHRRALVQLADALTAVVDLDTWSVARVLPAVGDESIAASFDPTGRLALRAGADGLSVWDLTTGDELPHSELLVGAAGRFLPDGTIELDGPHTAAVSIRSELRSRAQLVHDITCRVPLEVRGDQLALAQPQPACR
jgi:protein kinase-like protein